jgi:hypothetical protein
MPVLNPSPLAPGSLDLIRIIRQSHRCFIYGALGVLPWVGIGLALQSLRLRRRVALETNDPWRLPAVWTYWLLGLVSVAISDHFWGFFGAATAFFTVACIQTVHLWRSFPPEASRSSDSRWLASLRDPVVGSGEGPAARMLPEDESGGLERRHHGLRRPWNPGRYHLLWGTMLACGGLYATVAPVAAIGIRLGKMEWRL